MVELAESLRTAIAEAAAATAGVRVLYLFGSQATGNVWAESDVDIGVRWDHSLGADARAKATLVLIRELTDRLGRLGERADVVDLDRASSAVAFRAIRDGIRIHAASRKEANQLVVDVMRRYDDDAPRRELYRRAALKAVERMTEAQNSRR